VPSQSSLARRSLTARSLFNLLASLSQTHPRRQQVEMRNLVVKLDVDVAVAMAVDPEAIVAPVE
jgi:hypothetical protein